MHKVVACRLKQLLDLSVWITASENFELLATFVFLIRKFYNTILLEFGTTGIKTGKGQKQLLPWLWQVGSSSPHFYFMLPESLALRFETPELHTQTPMKTRCPVSVYLPQSSMLINDSISIIIDVQINLTTYIETKEQITRQCRNYKTFMKETEENRWKYLVYLDWGFNIVNISILFKSSIYFM